MLSLKVDLLAPSCFKLPLCPTSICLSLPLSSFSSISVSSKQDLGSILPGVRIILIQFLQSSSSSLDPMLPCPVFYFHSLSLPTLFLSFYQSSILQLKEQAQSQDRVFETPTVTYCFSQELNSWSPGSWIW